MALETGVLVKMTPELKKELKETAAKIGLNLSAFIRTTLIEKIRR